MRKEYRPSIIVLLEPRISSETADAICNRLGNNRWVRSKAFGFSGDMWVLWDDMAIGLSLKQADRFFLHFKVRMAGGLQWKLTTIYASPNSSIRSHLWEKLDEIEVRQPWAFIGDFNCVLLDEREDRSLGHPHASRIGLGGAA